MLDWLQQLLNQILEVLGFQTKSATVVLLGLDNAGKTTLLYKLKTGDISSFTPTERAHDETFQLGGITFKAWDLGGHQSVRHLWEDFFIDADGVIFMVDSSDDERLDEVKEELDALRESIPSPEVPVAVLFNKSDLHHALSNDELIPELGLPSDPHEVERPMQVFRTSVINGDGYVEAFQWLSQFV